MIGSKSSKKETKKTTKLKSTKNPKALVVTAYLMNGDKMEFFKRRASLGEIRVAAANKLDPKRFAPEIIVLRNGKKLDVQHSEGVLHIVALPVERDIDFWLNTLKAHGKAKDTDGVKRALDEMSQDARNEVLLRTVNSFLSFPLSKACVIELVEREEGVLAAEQNGRLGPLFPYSCWRARFADMLLRYGADPLTEDAFGYLCIHRASWKGYTQVVKLLLQRGVDVNTINRYGYTSLRYAVDGGRVGIVDILLRHGANTSVTDLFGGTVLIRASRNGYFKIARLLIKNGADINPIRPGERSSIHWACEKGHAKVVQLLLKHGARANDVESEDGLSCLHFASMGGYLDVAQLLLKHGAAVNLLCRRRCSCLMYACKKGHGGMARLLLEHGAAVNLNIHSRWSSLSWASQNGCVDIVKMLIKNGANPCAVDDEGRRADWWAKKNGHTDVQAMLLRAIASRSRDSNAPRMKSGSKNVLRKTKAMKSTRSKAK